MNLNHRGAPLLSAVIALVAAGSLLAACSRPTAAPAGPSLQPGPIPTFLEDRPQPGDPGYPPPNAPTNMPPEGYPQPDDAMTSTLPGFTITSTLPSETPTATMTDTLDATATP